MAGRSGVSPTIVILVAIVLALLGGGLLYAVVSSSGNQSTDDIGQTHEDADQKVDDQTSSLKDKLGQAILEGQEDSGGSGSDDSE